MLILRYFIIGLQLLLLAGAYVLKHLVSTKMGVMRHMLMLSNKWHAAFNPELVFILIGVFFIALGLWQFIHLRRRQRQWKPWFWLALLSFLYLLFIWWILYTDKQVFVLLLPILGIVLLLQLLQCILRPRIR